MQLSNENGRSMIEMLGVLAIIGVLTVGSLSIVGKTRQQYTISQILSESMTLISNARKMSCDYDEGYKTYTNMLYRSGAYPDGVRALKEASAGAEEITDSDGFAMAFLLSSDTILELKSEDSENSKFDAIFSNIPEEACVAVATADWNANGLIGASFDDQGDGKKKIELDAAAIGCSAASPKLVLTFKGCKRAD